MRHHNTPWCRWHAAPGCPARTAKSKRAQPATRGWGRKVVSMSDATAEQHVAVDHARLAVQAPPAPWRLNRPSSGEYTSHAGRAQSRAPDSGRRPVPTPSTTRCTRTPRAAALHPAPRHHVGARAGAIKDGLELDVGRGRIHLGDQGGKELRALRADLVVCGWRGRARQGDTIGCEVRAEFGDQRLGWSTCATRCASARYRRPSGVRPRTWT